MSSDLSVEAVPIRYMIRLVMTGLEKKNRQISKSLKGEKKCCPLELHGHEWSGRESIGLTLKERVMVKLIFIGCL